MGSGHYYAVDYEITYIDEQYLCILYTIEWRSARYYDGIILDLERGKRVTLEELGSSEEEMAALFPKANTIYAPIENGSYVQMRLQKNTREELMEEWKEAQNESNLKFYFRKDKVGYIMYGSYRGSIRMEIESDWITERMKK